MRITRTLVVICVLMTAPGRVSIGVVASQDQQPRLRGGVDVVALNVTVRDARRYVSDLRQDEFLILEDGRPQALTFFQRMGLPLALVLLLDTSASMQESLVVAQKAAVEFVRELGPGDVASVITFDTSVRLAQGFTADHNALERAIQQTSASGSTSLFNAVYVALKELRTAALVPGAEPRREAIVLLSDGADTASLVALDDLQDLAARGDTTIYSIGLGLQPPVSPRYVPDAQFVLRRLAEQTGGRTFLPRFPKELAAVYHEIKAELSSQYSIAYESTNGQRDGRFRRVAVRVAREGNTARTRPGYYAPEQ